MKHTDKFFLFPIKARNEEFHDDDLDKSDDWVLGYARMPINELYEITWFDCFSKGKDMADLVKKGSDLTRVCSERFGHYICLWDRKKFEQKLNDYMEKLEVDLSKSPPNEELEGD
jgi:hypothetical protein